MERKVPGSSGVGVIRRFFVAVCLAGPSLMAAVPANAGGMTGGATEVTQILNNIELVSQVGEAVETTANTLMTAQATMQQLRQLPEAVINEAMSGLPVDKVRAMADAYVVMSKAVGVYKDAEQVLRKAVQDAENLKISPSELLQAKADAALKHGGVYKETYESEAKKLQLLAKTSEEVQKQAEKVKSIDANVAGIQFLASQNVKLQSTMAMMADSIAKANANAAMEAEAKNKSEKTRLDLEKKVEDEIKKNQEKAKSYSFDSNNLIKPLK